MWFLHNPHWIQLGGLFEIRWLLPGLEGLLNQEAQKIQYTVPFRAWSHVGCLHLLAIAPSFGHLSLVVVHFEGIHKSPD